MKRLFTLLCVLWILPSVVSAHTTVKNSSPTEGQVITHELTEISVEFAGIIENQSTLTLTKENNEEPFKSITVEEKKLTGVLQTPLSNGSYTLTWKVAAKDGHILTGDIPFTVQLSKDEVIPETPTSDVNPIDKESNIEGTSKVEDKVEEKKETISNEAEPTSNSSFATFSVIILVLLLASGIWILFRKKR